MVDLTFLPVAEPDIGPLEEQYVLEAVRSGWISSIGAFIDRFEREFAAFCGVQHCIAVANGTVALHLALVAKGIGQGDEVIVPDLTFVATAATVIHAGATPVLVDVDPVSLCLDPALVEAAITPKTRAIVPVHLYGHPAAMNELRAIAGRHGLFLLEDAAEAHGAQIGDRRVGSLGDAACFSFYGNKLITTGEGGCITTNDTAYAERLRFLKDHAMSRERRYFHPEVGFNYRMTNLQAAVGCAQLARFDEMRASKDRVLGWYRKHLEGSGLALNPRRDGVSTVCWLVTTMVPGATSERLEQMSKLLRGEHRVDVRPFFVPLHELPPYAGYRLVRGETSISKSAAARGLCLPSSNHLRDEDVARVAAALRDVLRRTE